MIRGYVSSDEDDYDDYDFGYSEPLIIKKEESPRLPDFQIPDNKEKLYSVLKESEKIELFFKSINLEDVTALEELISHGVSVECLDGQKWTPLIKACGTGNPDIVQFLLENGANPNKHRELLTPLMTCCTHTLVSEHLKLNCVRLLLEYGAEVNAKDKYRTTALMYATQSGYAEIVAWLLQVPGIDINVQDKEGWTALFYAVQINDINLVTKLFSAGTDLNLKDRLGRTVINVALDKDLLDMAKLLGYEDKNDYKPKKLKTLRKKFLDKLPNSSGQGGFASDAKNILHAFNQFKVESISLPDLLNATEKDLLEIGVILRPDRHKILSRGIHLYHLHPWKKSSLPEIKQGVPLCMEDAIAIMGALVKHLTIANASLRYLDTRISLRQNKEPADLAIEKEMIICLISVYQSAGKLKIILPKIVEHFKQIKPGIAADFIGPLKQERKGKEEKSRKFFLYAFGTGIAAAIALQCLVLKH